MSRDENFIPHIELYPRYCHIRIDYEITALSEPPEESRAGFAVATVTSTDQIPDALRAIADIMQKNLEEPSIPLSKEQLWALAEEHMTDNENDDGWDISCMICGETFYNMGRLKDGDFGETHMQEHAEAGELPKENH